MTISKNYGTALAQNQRVDFNQWCREETHRLEMIGFHADAAVDFSGAAPTPPGRGRLGIGMECLDRDLWEYRPALPGLIELGIRFARLQSGWAKTEKTPGVYDFVWLDEQVDALLAAGVEPWLSLSYGNPLYVEGAQERRADGLAHNPLHSPRGLRGWCAYVQAAVEHFRDRIHCFEIWNEPDVSIFFPTAGGEGDWCRQYYDLVRHTVPIIRETAPAAQIVVVTGGGTGANARGCARLLELGIGALADVYAFHAYSYTPERFDALSRNAFYNLFRRRAPGMKIWRGEAGIASYHDEGTQEALCDYPVNETIQLRWIGRHLIRDLGDPVLGLTSCFHLSDFLHFSGSCHYYFGMLRGGDCSRKPAFYLLQFLKRFLDDGAAVPDSSFYMECGDVTRWTHRLPESLLFDVEVVPFRRNDAPVFAYWHRTSVWKEMAPAQVWENSFTGVSDGRWLQPVVVDPCTRNVYSLSLREGEERLRIPLLNRPLLLMEAEALEPYLRLAPPVQGRMLRAEAVQADHE